MFDEKQSFPDVWINGGVYVLNSRKMQRYLTGKGDIERETFPKLVSHGDLLSFPHYGEWWYIDTLKDLRELEAAVQPAT